ncbi:hypothetical protein JQX09_00220 [Sulfitobacter pseudonitzschiae]|uniref:Uncharacterized protein n=1 Tax=Pseudosulfitobacter pseudonitzschiae TaxID=1402135 RepID=A0A9Q2NYP2_9RHOB|nr:hypothetical protein [Pseudosulfitobacter pseudonitzschiae]MBM2290315.1 hypothetical protein [Pseudosulfitobacter pseudonitzschiae]MBM2295233.1 hypothetical protein [Pseudosulfitobacter pseudonitzschiae]MBM2300145.1 hypothetical protein [Pseudosulfitobacter pseudonitzschiae]MBM2309930.1 hypothetical protein [Pseudosulfitobacter pseudonitzschiae]MBM2314842.1 hypothetical protein [Pseudosulfitobacter pseudonitzschiae]
MKLLRNYQIFRAQRLAAKGDFITARSITNALVAKFPRSVGYNLFNADIDLFAGDTTSALDRYEICKELVEVSSEMSFRNKRFYNAYINFRQIAIDHHLAGHEWPEWSEFAMLVNVLDADRNIKNLFLLPTK